MNNVIAACCVLHNLCKIFQEDFDPDLLQETGLISHQMQHPAAVRENATVRNGDAVRNALVQYCQDIDVQKKHK